MLQENQRIQELRALKIIAESLNQANDLSTMLQSVLEELLRVTGLTTGWIYLIDEKGRYSLAADHQLPEALRKENKKPMCEGGCWCLDRYQDGRLKRASNIIACKRIEDALAFEWGDTNDITHHATVPLRAGEEKFGLLNIASPNKTHFEDSELALLESVALQIGTAIKRIRLTENEQHLSILAERNRLARDLHDSVNQLLFSLMLTARGTKELTQDPQIVEMLEYMQELSQEALSEMRALIWQLRPQGLENGVVSALLNYGKVLGLTIHSEVKGVVDLPNHMEECLWRIGQEALNNCKKHAGIKEACMNIEVKNKHVSMEIIDKGAGFSFTQSKEIPSLGLRSMKERTEALKGKFTVISELGKGTVVRVEMPVTKEENK
ncbi:Sensor histidine kinase LiaS [Bacillus sp. THAF10]|uniref:GAF domain-containing sensor histidine kinase n=1 Tax=Bacillus sp. THAF10 TaxID=2587848 RepID=UPI0012693364|nr:GAF domain-containing sensor histidine kinase [Bacillus sp. THAF10]QFT88159.1 Sensor histidine kinase LiaS [Bacillus sp. THAF10]